MRRALLLIITSIFRYILLKSTKLNQSNVKMKSKHKQKSSYHDNSNSALPNIMSQAITGKAILKTDVHSTLKTSPEKPYDGHTKVTTLKSTLGLKEGQSEGIGHSGDITSTIQLSQRQSTIETPGISPFEKSKHHLSNFQSGLNISKTKDLTPNLPLDQIKIGTSSSSFAVIASHKVESEQNISNQPFGQSSILSQHDFVKAYQKENLMTVPQQNLPQVKKNLQVQKQAQYIVKAGKISVSKQTLMKKKPGSLTPLPVYNSEQEANSSMTTGARDQVKQEQQTKKNAFIAQQMIQLHEDHQQLGQQQQTKKGSVLGKGYPFAVAKKTSQQLPNFKMGYQTHNEQIQNESNNGSRSMLDIKVKPAHLIRHASNQSIMSVKGRQYDSIMEQRRYINYTMGTEAENSRENSQIYDDANAYQFQSLFDKSIDNRPMYNNSVDAAYSQQISHRKQKPVKFDVAQSNLRSAMQYEQYRQKQFESSVDQASEESENQYYKLQEAYSKAFQTQSMRPSRSMIGIRAPNSLLNDQSTIADTRKEDMLTKLERDRENISVLLQQYSGSVPNYKPGETDLEQAMHVNYYDTKTTKKMRMDAQLASLRVKRRTRFDPLPRRVNSVMQIYPVSKLTGETPRMADGVRSQRDMSQLGVFGNHSVEGKEKSILDYEDHELSPGRMAAKKRFIQFDQKIRKEQAALNYESNTESSNDSDSDKPIDYDKDFDENFYKKSLDLQKKGHVSLLDIISKPADKRTNEERDHIVVHLMFRVPFFADYKRDHLVPISERVECKKYKAKETLMDQGDIGECMFIIFSGSCGIYKFRTNQKSQGEHSEVATIGANIVVGERAVMDEETNVRDATVMAQSDVVALIMTKQDYLEIAYQIQVANRLKRLDFLNKQPFFKAWEKVKLSDFNFKARQLKPQQGQTIYDIGQDSGTFYVVREGKLAMETIIEVESYFKYPIDRNKWEIRKKIRRIQYKLQELSQGSMFGHEEMIQGGTRQCRIRCLTACTLIYINKEEMEMCFPKKSIELLKSNMRDLNLDSIVEKITKYQHLKTTTNKAILDATKTNQQHFKGRKMQLMPLNDQTRINKLQPWLQKVKDNATQNQNVLHELRKVKQLFVREEKYTVRKDDDKNTPDSESEDGTKRAWNESITHKKKARFVMPEESKVRMDMIKNFNPDSIKKEKERETQQKQDAQDKREKMKRLQGRKTIAISSQEEVLFNRKSNIDKQLEKNQNAIQGRIRGTIQMVNPNPRNHRLVSMHSVEMPDIKEEPI